MSQTNITLTIGEIVIPAVLQASTASAALLNMLPLRLHLQRYAHDYCGVMPELPYEQADLKQGWTNGDLAFAADGHYLAILYKDEEISAQYDNLVPLGQLAVPPAIMENLDSSISVLIAVAA